MSHCRIVSKFWICVCFLVGGFAFAPAVVLQAVAAVVQSSENKLASSADSTAASTTALKRIGELRAELAHHNTLYFEKAAPEISDAQYDDLKRELSRLEQAFPDAAKGAGVPSSDIGDDRTEGFETVHHRAPMLSLAKAYNEAELRTFLARVQAAFPSRETAFVVEPKFDGVAVSITYENGELTRAITRGDGHVGDDVTVNVLALRNLPHRLAAKTSDGKRNPIPELIELRGEIFLSNGEFQRINREQEAAGETPFAHPRNLAAGTLKQHNPGLIAARGLEVVLYGYGTIIPERLAPTTQTNLHEMIRSWSLPGVSDAQLVKTPDEVWSAVKTLGERRTRLGFPTDGAVVKLDSVSQQHQLGNSDSAPRWAIAYKFSAERAETTLNAIRLQVGRSGVITPVAELSPVRIAGTTVTRASLYNRAEIARRDLRIGDTVVLEKAGEIVPAIVGVDLARRFAGSAPFVFPTSCPSCGEKVSDEGLFISRCTNRDCPAQIRGRLEHFASKDAVAISGLGPATIESLVAKGWVREPSDLYRLQRDQLLTLGKNVDASSDRLLAAIETSKHAELWRFIHGLGIPQIGSTGARIVAQQFGNLPALARATADSLERKRAALKRALGENAAEELIAYLRKEKNRAIIEHIVSLGIHPADSFAVPNDQEPASSIEKSP